MKVSFHGVTVVVAEEKIVGLDQQRVKAALYAIAGDIFEHVADSNQEHINPPIEHWTNVGLQDGKVAIMGSIDGNEYGIMIT